MTEIKKECISVQVYAKKKNIVGMRDVSES